MKLAVWLIAAFTLLQACKLFLPTLARQDVYEDDAAQHIWWMYQFQDPALFPDDPSVAYFRRLIDPPGYKMLFGALGRFIDAQVLSEALPFVLCVPMVVLAFWLSRDAAKGVVAGAIAGSAYLIYVAMHGLRGGFPRSFALPILLLGVWAITSRRLAWLGSAFVASALFFPPMAITLGLFSLTVLGIRISREKKMPSGWAACGLLTMLAASIVLTVYGRTPPAGIGRPPTRQEAEAMPEYHAGGRIKFFDSDWRNYYFGSKPSAVGLGLGMSAAVVLLLAVTVAVYPRAISLEAWVLLATSLSAFVLAHALLFRLYFPNRYTMYALPVFGMMWVASVAGQMFSRDAAGAGPLQGLVRLIGRPRVGVSLAAAAVLLGAVAVGVDVKKRLAGPPSWSPGKGGEQVAAFLRTLPRQTLVAAHPDDAGHIPLRARRSVLASTEMSVPLHVEFYRQCAERTEAELEACYASDWKEVDALRDRYGAAVFVVNRMRYSDMPSIRYLEPFRKKNEDRVALGREKGFVLLHPPAERVLFEAGDMVVIRLGK